MNDIEQQLVEAARRGQWLTCAKPDQVVRGEVIRELLLGRHGELDPRGVRLSGARIVGDFDLEHVDAGVGMFLQRCMIEEPIRAGRSVLPYLVLHGGQRAGLETTRTARSTWSVPTLAVTSNWRTWRSATTPASR